MNNRFERHSATHRHLLEAETVIESNLGNREATDLRIQAALDANAGFQVRTEGEQYATPDGFMHVVPSGQFRVEIKCTPDAMRAYRERLSELKGQIK